MDLRTQCLTMPSATLSLLYPTCSWLPDLDWAPVGSLVTASTREAVRFPLHRSTGQGIGIASSLQVGLIILLGSPTEGRLEEAALDSKPPIPELEAGLSGLPIQPKGLGGAGLSFLLVVFSIIEMIWSTYSWRSFMFRASAAP